MPLMLSELQQKDVWEGWLGAEARAYYFADQCRFWTVVHRGITWAILFSSSGAAVAVLTGLPDAVRVVLALVPAGFSLWLLIANYPRTANECSDVYFRWNRLALDYKTLWDDMYAADASQRLADLQLRDAELSKACNQLPYRKRELLKWQRYVVDQHGLPAHA